MARFFRQGVMVCIVLGMVAGCGDKTQDPPKRPTVAQAGETLKLHIMALMEKINAQDVKIIDQGGRDIPCGEGLAKRAFAITGRSLSQNIRPYSLNLDLVGMLNSVASYQIVEEHGPGPIRMARSVDGTVIILDSPANGQYQVRGETECLSAS